MKQYKGVRNLAFKLHRLFYRVYSGKNPEHQDFDYYTAALAYFDKRFDEIEKTLKDVAKQQKYLWQTLEENKNGS